MIECSKIFTQTARLFRRLKLAELNNAWCKLTLRTFLFVLSCSLLGACSDSPGGGIGGTGKVPEILATGLLIGPIESTDQFSINDTRLNVSSTSVTVNGNSASYDELQPGMNVTARVNYAESSIDSIEYQPILVGPIESIAADLSSFVALDQTVKTTEYTQYGNLDITSIYEGAIVEVSGIRDVENNIVASFIGLESTIDERFFIGVVEERLEESNDVILSGTVVSLDSIIEENDAASTTTTLNSLTPGDSIKAEMNPHIDTTGETMETSVIELIENLLPQQNENVSINGVVRSIVDPDIFTINKYTFRTSELTTFFGRSGERLWFYLIGTNDKVLVNGIVGSDGVILVKTIKIKSAQEPGFEGQAR